MKKRNMVTIPSYCLLLVVCVSKVIAQLDSDCVTPNKEKAKCIRLTGCEVIYSAVQTRNSTALEFAQKSHCGHDGKIPLVCCGTTGFPKPALSLDDIFDLFPKQPEVKPPPQIKTFTPTPPPPPPPQQEQEPLEDFKTNALPDRTVCGVDKDSSRIWGGEQTDLDEFPWLVALEFKKARTGKPVGVRCGGSLINNRYVLTAAHCIVNREFELTNVRLGEWDVTKDPDCVEYEAQSECADEMVKVDVEEKYPHPYYSRSGNHDIALVKLARDIEYTGYIRPICLPPRNLPVAPLSSRMTVSGWGVTENNTASDIKLKVEVPLLTNQECMKKMKGKHIGVNQMCAGGELGKDSCQGDSGGPLMRTFEDPVTQQTQWYQEGVVHAGVGCARAGYPAVYTRVDRYVNWIIGIIQDSEEEED